ncbi:MAG: cytochrome c oxidase subunit II [Bacteroidota bacterium]
MYTSSPQNASNFVAGVDLAFLIILGVAFLFLISLTTIMIIFIRKYRRDRHPEAVQNEGNNLLELLWTLIPALLVLVMFYFGWMGWKPMRTPPEDARHVKAIARMWQFRFEYENGKVTDSLFVPVGEPVILDLVALDVIHSLYIPSFRVKEDMVPGRVKQMWFTPGRVGNYDLFCAEYCGLQHSYMYTGVKVMPKEEFDSWIADTTAMAPVVTAEMSPADQGYQLMIKNGCNACHSNDGSKLVGPSYLGNWGKSHTVITGGQEREVVMDEEYVIRSIFDPNYDLVKGYNKGLMLSYKGQITEDEARLIAGYIKALNEK